MGPQTKFAPWLISYTWQLRMIFTMSKSFKEEEEEEERETKYGQQSLKYLLSNLLQKKFVNPNKNFAYLTEKGLLLSKYFRMEIYIFFLNMVVSPNRMSH